MARTPSTMAPLGTIAPPFDLPDTNGPGSVASTDYSGQPLLVVFLCNHCPFVIHLRDHFADFARRAQDRGLAVVGISSNDAVAYPADGPDKMAEEAEAAGYTFPYLFDETQEVAKAYGAACTPDFFLFDADHRLVYRGQYDASRPGNDVPVTGEDLAAAIDAVLEGKAVSEAQLPSLGCNIKWKPGNEPAWFG